MIDVSKCLEALRDYRRFGFGMIGGPDKKVHVTEIIALIEELARMTLPELPKEEPR